MSVRMRRHKMVCAICAARAVSHVNGAYFCGYHVLDGLRFAITGMLVEAGKEVDDPVVERAVDKIIIDIARQIEDTSEHPTDAQLKALFVKVGRGWRPEPVDPLVAHVDACWRCMARIDEMFSR